MNKSSNDSISASRRSLHDPFNALPTAAQAKANVAHGLPHDLIDKYSVRETATQIKPRYSSIEIEQRARGLQASLWQDRDQIWPVAPTNPINVLDPFVALRLLGYDCELEETLGQFQSDGKPVEIAGVLDKQARQVRISRRVDNAARSITAAHELGHALLHDTGATMHRDRPLDGSVRSRTGIEFEADKFASFFLMPAKQVQEAFERFFLTDQFELSEATAFALGQGEYATLSNKCKTLRQLSRLLASAEHFNGVHFMSLSSQFLVSNEAMAIRLEELQLVYL